MSQEDSAPPSDETQKVGYCNPPRNTRIQKGEKRNPRGRPKGKRSIVKMLDDALAAPTTITEKGKPRKVSMLELIIKRLVADSARGVTSSIKLLMGFQDRYGGTSASTIAIGDLLAEDREILTAYMAQQEGPFKQGGTETPLKSE